MHLVQQFLCFENQHQGLYFMNHLPTKSCLLQYGAHLLCQRIALMRKGTQLVRQCGVCAVVVGAATLYRPRRDGERVHAELSERSVKLFIHLSELPQGLTALPQRVRYCPGVELIDEHAAIVVIRILETNQG